MTVPIGITIFFVFIKLSDTSHIKSRVLRDLFPLLATRNYQESSSNATFFLDPLAVINSKNRSKMELQTKMEL